MDSVYLDNKNGKFTQCFEKKNKKNKGKMEAMAGSNAIEIRPYQGYDIAFSTHHKEYCLRQRKMALILRLYIRLPLFAFTSLISMETWKRARRSYNLCGCWSHTNKKTSEEKKNITAHTNEWMWISHLRSEHTKKDPSLVVAVFFLRLHSSIQLYTYSYKCVQIYNIETTFHLNADDCITITAMG